MNKRRDVAVGVAKGNPRTLIAMIDCLTGEGE